MIRVTGRYAVVEGSLEDFDELFDVLLGALALDATVRDPDLALDLNEGSLQVEFIIDTDDAWTAGQISHEAMGRAFAAAGVEGPDGTRLYAHQDLLNQAPSSLELSLVPA